MNNQALIIVDYQNDFVDPNLGSLYVPGAENISGEINNLMYETKTKGGLIIASREIHSQGHISFASNFIGKQSVTVSGANKQSMITYSEIKTWTDKNNGLSDAAKFTVKELLTYIQINGDQVLWPDHCVKDTNGSNYFKDLDTSLIDKEVIKGNEIDKHPYSAFEGIEKNTNKSLSQLLEEAKIQTLKVVGVATDYCDIATVLDGLKKYPVEFIKKASAGVDPSTTLEAIKQMREKGAKII